MSCVTPMDPVHVVASDDDEDEDADVDHEHAAVEGQPKRRKRALVATLVDAPKARKMATAFKGEGFEERKGKLFCVFCNHDVPFSDKAAVRQHLHGRRSKGKLPFAERTEADKLKITHYKNKCEHRAAEDKKNALVHATESYRQAIWDRDRVEWGGAAPQPGGHVPAQSQADRLSVLETLWHTGVPVNTLRNARFLRLVEQPHLALGALMVCARWHHWHRRGRLMR